MRLLTFQIEDEWHEKLREIKEVTGISLSFSARKAIKDYCENLLKHPDFLRLKNGDET